MRKYCKAYQLRELRQFAGWTEKPQADGAVLNDDDICFIWDDFTVQAKSPFPEQGTLFDDVTPEWRAFCTEQLHFAIPDDLQYAYEQDANSSSNTANIS